MANSIQLAARRIASLQMVQMVNNRTAHAQFSTTADKIKASRTAPESEIKKSVFISQSRDVFTNLALEDWLYRNMDFTKHHVLMLWQNSPTIVIGRHQNPWLEANTQALTDRGIDIARRNSGGGTVYHDGGNLNLTFFTARDSYKRRRNLDIVSRALFREFNLCSQINEREDIVVNGNKISGTAAKLGNPNAYHHCTVLVDVNKMHLHNTLTKLEKCITTNATRSIPSPITNLRDMNPHVTVEKLLGAVGWEFLRSTALSIEDGGLDLASKQRGFQLVNPTEDWFPGIDKIREEFVSWAWRFGKTPEFTVTRNFPVPEDLANRVANMSLDANEQLTITLEVAKGIIKDVTLRVPPNVMTSKGFSGDAEVLTSLKGKRFNESAVEILEDSLGKPSASELQSSFREAMSSDSEGERFVADCMRQTMMAV